LKTGGNALLRDADNGRIKRESRELLRELKNWTMMLAQHREIRVFGELKIEVER
jgi:hypothetical protein